MKIGITLKPTAYTPEAYAYKDYLEERGHSVQLGFSEELYPDNDINIYFMGIRPFWTKAQKATEIHEYQSLSVPPYSNFKDIIKKNINKKPVGRVFLNNVVKKHLGFSDGIPSINRDMGVDEGFYRDIVATKEYDIVYSGTIDSRIGLIEALRELAQQGYKLLVIGEISSESENTLKSSGNVTCVGKQPYSELPKLYKQATYGVNYTPNIFPFNLQTSTKTLEYLACGLHLISNRYEWIETFCLENHYQPIWLEDIGQLDIVENQLKMLPDMSRYTWENILDQARFEQFLIRMHEDE